LCLRLRLRWLRLRLRWGRSVISNLRSIGRRPRYKPGLHAYNLTRPNERVRAHLRIEPNGEALLLINANRALHLNPSAAYIAWTYLEGMAHHSAVQLLRKRFNIPVEDALRDVPNIHSQIEALLWGDGNCPIHDLQLELLPPFSQAPSAPYRMDLALTYRCNNHCPHCYNARERTFPELRAEEWFTIIDQLWELGVPHICFTGGEATLYQDLDQLIQRAEANGQITGLLSNGRRLADKSYLQRLVTAGLDHIQITLESHIPEIHDQMVAAQGGWKQTVVGIRNVVDAGIFVMTNTTLLRENAESIEDTIDFVADLGVPTVGINALIYAGQGKTVGTGLHEEELGPLLERVRAKTDERDLRLIWYTPTQYCHFDPVQLQLGVKACTAAQYNMCVEPDGSVLPCQSFYEPLGNLKHDSWDSIWNHELATWLRERKYVPQTCNDCAVLQECGGGCPLTLRNQPDQQPTPYIAEILMEG
jgi:radical SAM protein with 4Fe4S-binding SPASM domain